MKNLTPRKILEYEGVKKVLICLLEKSNYVYGIYKQTGVGWPHIYRVTRMFEKYGLCKIDKPKGTGNKRIIRLTDKGKTIGIMLFDMQMFLNGLEEVR